MGDALVRQQHVVDDVGQALVFSLFVLLLFFGVAGQRIGLLDVIDAVDEAAEFCGVIGRVRRLGDMDEGDELEAERFAG